MEIPVKVELLNQMLAYLQKRPYEEVAVLIAKILQLNETVTKEEPKNG